MNFKSIHLLYFQKWQLGIVFLPDSIGYLIGTKFFAVPALKFGRSRMAMVALSMVSLGCFTVCNLIENTDSTKINRPGHNIRMYWTYFWQPTTHVQQNIFEKTLIEGCSPHLYASFGTFCVQISQLFAAQWVFKQSEEFRNRRHFPSMRAICRFSNILQRLTMPQIIDQFGHKRCQMKRKDENYKIL